MGKYTVITGIQNCAKKVVNYGPEGVGKTTFASKFPNPVFIDIEGSTSDYNLNRYPRPTSYEMLCDEIRDIMNDHLYQTIVIDTGDWAETLVINSICSKHNKKSIEDFGYGNGWTLLLEEWGRFLNLLTEVVESGINVVVNCHSIINKFEQPDEMGAYDRYELKLGNKTKGKTAPLLKEWANMILFANYEVFSVSADNSGKKKKAQGGRRVMFTTHHPCWDAKNRYGLPEKCDYDYEVIRHIIEPNSQPVQQQHQQTNAYVAPQTYQQPVQQASVAVPHVEDEQVQSFDIPEEKNTPQIGAGIPKTLADLMIANCVFEEQIRRVVADRGYYPYETPIANYDPDFVDGVLVGAWDQVYAIINDIQF